jgi:hypothetical protein
MLTNIASMGNGPMTPGTWKYHDFSSHNHSNTVLQTYFYTGVDDRGILLGVLPGSPIYDRPEKARVLQLVGKDR